VDVFDHVVTRRRDEETVVCGDDDDASREEVVYENHKSSINIAINRSQGLSCTLVWGTYSGDSVSDRPSRL